MRLRPVNPDGNLRAGGAELLEEAAVRPDPEVIFSDLHLSNRGQTSTALRPAEPAEEHLGAGPALHTGSSMSIPKASRIPQKRPGAISNLSFQTRDFGQLATLGLLVALMFPAHNGGQR